MSEKPDTNKLLKLMCERLESLPDDKVDMTMWLGETACGTVGCAVGNCLDILGLELRQAPSRIDRWNRNIPYHPATDHWNIPAVAFALGISSTDAAFLFLPGAYHLAEPERIVTRLDVLDRLREFISFGSDIVPEEFESEFGSTWVEDTE